MAVLQGTLDMIILQSLRRRQRPGAGIGQFIRSQSRGDLSVESGSLYPALKRLVRSGYVATEMRTDVSRRHRKVYALTAEGERHLVETRARWNRLAFAIERVLCDRSGPPD